MKGPTDIRVHGLSDIGRVREDNQDSFLIRQPEDDSLRRRRGALLVVADGMGGLAGGKDASRIASERTAAKYFELEGDPPEALTAAVKAANREIFEHAQADASGQPMGSTCTALAVLDHYACVAQVGDSRAYRLHRGQIRQVTRDHSLVRELLDRGEIEIDSAQYAFHRNVLTRGMGLREEVDVDIFELDDVEDGDVFFLTSDGLHELVGPEELVDTFAREGGDLVATASALIDLANERGGNDNITIGLLVVGAVDLSQLGNPSTDTLDVAVGQADREKVGCLLPAAVVVSFALGVGATLFLEGLRGADAERRAETAAAELEAVTEALPEADATARKLREIIDDLRG